MLSHVRLFCEPMDCSPTRLLCPWDFPSKNTGVGHRFLLQGVFLRLMHWHGGFFTTEPPEKPPVQWEWSPKGESWREGQPGDLTGVLRERPLQKGPVMSKQGFPCSVRTRYLGGINSLCVPTSHESRDITGRSQGLWEHSPRVGAEG